MHPSPAAGVEKKTIGAILPAMQTRKKRKMMKDGAPVHVIGGSDQPLMALPTVAVVASISEAKAPSPALPSTVPAGKSGTRLAPVASVGAAFSSEAAPAPTPSFGVGSGRGDLYPVTDAEEIFRFLDSHLSDAARVKLDDPVIDSAAAQVITSSMEAAVRAAYLVARVEERHVKNVKAFGRLRDAYNSQKERVSELSAEVKDLQAKLGSVKDLEEHTVKLGRTMEERTQALLAAETQLAMERSTRSDLERKLECATFKLTDLNSSVPRIKADAVDEYVNSAEAIADFRVYYKQGFEECRGLASGKYPGCDFSSLRPMVEDDDEEEEAVSEAASVAEVQMAKVLGTQGDLGIGVAILAGPLAKPEVVVIEGLKSQGDLSRETGGPTVARERIEAIHQLVAVKKEPGVEARSAT